MKLIANLVSHAKRLPNCKIILAGITLSAPSLRAQSVDGSWFLNNNGVWSDSANWTTSPAGQIPGGEGSVVNINRTFTSGTTRFVTIDTTPRTVGTLTIGDAGNLRLITVNASGGGTLTFDGAGSANAQLNKSVGNSDTISAPIILNSGLDITNNDDNDLTLSGTLTGSSLITIKGTGRTVIGGTVNNTGFSGGVTVESGTLSVNTHTINVLGSGTLTLKGGTFRAETSSNTLNLGQNLGIEGTVGLSSGSGGVTFSGNTTVNGNTTINSSAGGATGGGRNATFSNISGGNGNLTLNATSGSGTNAMLGFRVGSANHTGTLTNASTGSGWVIVTGAVGANVTGVIQDSATSTMRLDGTNTYTSLTEVKAGTLQVAGTINSSSGVSISGGTFLYSNNTTALNRSVTVTGGDFRYNSTQAYTGSLTFSSGKISGTGNLSGTALTIGSGQTLSPGNSPGTLTTGSETWAAGGTYLWEINALATSTPAGVEGAATGWDFANINGVLSITAGPGQFNLTLDSLVALNNWDNTATYQWRIATASGGVSGFDASAFNINTTQFAAENNLGTGVFTVTNVGNNIYLNFAPVPEPSVAALVALGGLAIVLRRPGRKQS